MKDIIYDEAYHVEALLEMLEAKDICEFCPRDDGHNSDFHRHLVYKFDRDDLYFEAKMEACTVCHTFIGLDDNGGCPCINLSSDVAVKRTWIALEEKGYI